MKYFNVIEAFAEVPDEISLYIPITGCIIKCPDCNSKWLWKNDGKILNMESLTKLIHSHKGITCICLGGGEHDMEGLNILFKFIKENQLKTCWYTGYDVIPKDINLQYLDYIKVGHFEKYPLNDKRTNQKFYKIATEVKDNKIVGFNELSDITYKFWK